MAAKPRTSPPPDHLVSPLEGELLRSIRNPEDHYRALLEWEDQCIHAEEQMDWRTEPDQEESEGTVLER